MSIEVMIVDDHVMMRDGLRSILEKEGDIRVVDEAGDGRAALDKLAVHQPDIVIMDVALPDLNGVDATRKIHEAFPRVRVVALSTHADKRYVSAMLEAGARGYVLKEAAAADLVSAARVVLRDQVYLSPRVAADVVESYVGARADRVGGAALGGREREVLQLIAEGESSKMIAGVLGIAVSTVEVHRRNIMRKLGLHTIAELTKYAIREGLTSVER